MELLTSLLSALLNFCYSFTSNWWVAILLLTIITKLILLPISLWSQWNSIVMLRLMPELNRIKVKYFGDNETIGEKQSELNKKYHYHPLLSLIPLAIQILILVGLIGVIRTITESGSSDTAFLGMVPATDGGMAWIMPVLAGLSSLALGFAQNHINPLQREQSPKEQWSTNGFSIALSLVLAVYVAAGMAFYWICSNLMGIVVQLLCNLIMKPAKYVDYPELQASKAELNELNSLSKNSGPWYKPNALAKRAKQDYKRFFGTANKHLVIYSEKSGFYKYYQGAIEWLLNNSNVRIHYVTSDPNDQVFELEKTNPRLMPYYIDDTRLITLFMKMDADVVYTALYDLDTYYLKRSYTHKDTKYLATFHHMTSTTLVVEEKAFDAYDAVLCAGPHQKKEIEAREELCKLPHKDLVECGYALLDNQIAEYNKREHPKNETPTILIAPSWQEDNILDLCAEDTINPLLGHGWKVILRPHPEYLKRYASRWEALKAKYANRPESEIVFEEDFSTNDSIFTSDVLITDWSSVYCEFCFITLKPCVFINTPMKVRNPNWQATGIEPVDIAWRNQLGKAVEPKDLNNLPDIISEMIENPEAWHNQIEQVRSEHIYNLGHAGEVAGRYILDTLLAQQAKHESEANNAR